MSPPLQMAGLIHRKVAGAVVARLLLIEVHKAEFLDEITRRWEAVVGPLDQADQKAIPMLGREQRIAENWWLASQMT